MGKHKVKPQWDITVCLSEWLKSKITIIPPNAKKLNHSYIASGNVTGRTTLEINSAVPLKTKHETTHSPVTAVLGTDPKMETYVHTKTCGWMFIVALFEPKNVKNPCVFKWVNG